MVVIRKTRRVSGQAREARVERDVLEGERPASLEQLRSLISQKNQVILHHWDGILGNFRGATLDQAAREAHQSLTREHGFRQLEIQGYEAEGSIRGGKQETGTTVRRRCE